MLQYSISLREMLWIVRPSPQDKKAGPRVASFFLSCGDKRHPLHPLKGALRCTVCTGCLRQLFKGYVYWLSLDQLLPPLPYLQRKYGKGSAGRLMAAFLFVCSSCKTLSTPICPRDVCKGTNRGQFNMIGLIVHTSPYHSIFLTGLAWITNCR